MIQPALSVRMPPKSRIRTISRHMAWMRPESRGTTGKMLITNITGRHKSELAQAPWRARAFGELPACVTWPFREYSFSQPQSVARHSGGIQLLSETTVQGDGIRACRLCDAPTIRNAATSDTRRIEYLPDVDSLKSLSCLCYVYWKALSKPKSEKLSYGCW